MDHNSNLSILDFDEWREIPYRNSTGKITDFPCTHPEQLPGLDAIGCPICKTWWVDKEMRNELVPKKKRGSDG